MKLHFFVQRPTGYMSPYFWRGVRHDRYNARRFNRGYDPVYLRLGRYNFRLPMRGPYRPRKELS